MNDYLVGYNGTTCCSGICCNLVLVSCNLIDRQRATRTTTPPSNKHPTIVVPVLVALGNGTPAAWRARFLL